MPHNSKAFGVKDKIIVQQREIDDGTGKLVGWCIPGKQPSSGFPEQTAAKSIQQVDTIH